MRAWRRGLSLQDATNIVYNAMFIATLTAGNELKSMESLISFGIAERTTINCVISGNSITKYDSSDAKNPVHEERESVNSDGALRPFASCLSACCSSSGLL